MLAKQIFTAVLWVAASLSAAQAATETYSFLDDYAGTYYASKDFTSNMGHTVTVAAGTYGASISGGAEGPAMVGQWTGYGLGVCSVGGGSVGCDDKHFVEGAGSHEFLTFSFAREVTIELIQFKDLGDNFFDLTLADGTDLRDRTYTAAGVFQSTIDAMGNMFALGAFNWTSGFKVQSITVSYDEPSEVPLPAAGWLLIAGLGGLAAMKRRSA